MSRKFKIIIDPGHAESTKGKCMVDPETGNVFYEYISNRSIAKLVYDGCVEMNIPCEYVINPDEKYDVPISKRAQLANEIANEFGKDKCLYISIHSDACGNGRTWENAGGWSIWTSVGKTQSDEYAEIFFEEAKKILPEYGFKLRKDLSDGDNDCESNFTVLKNTICPAVLIENLFFTNRVEQAFLKSDKGKSILAKVILNAIDRITAER